MSEAKVSYCFVILYLHRLSGLVATNIPVDIKVVFSALTKTVNSSMISELIYELQHLL